MGHYREDDRSTEEILKDKEEEEARLLLDIEKRAGIKVVSGSAEYLLLKDKLAAFDKLIRWIHVSRLNPTLLKLLKEAVAEKEMSYYLKVSELSNLPEVVEEGAYDSFPQKVTEVIGSAGIYKVYEPGINTYFWRNI